MATIIANSILQVRNIVEILEDNMPQCSLETDESVPYLDAEILVKKATNIGVKITLRIHRLDLSSEKLDKLKEAGIDSAVIDGLQQLSGESPLPFDELDTKLRKIIARSKANDFFTSDLRTLFNTCGINSAVVLGAWDPHSFAGALTGGSSFYISHQFDLLKEVFDLLMENIDHESGDCSEANGCFIATAAAGNINDKNVMLLRLFRDTYLVYTVPGRIFIRFYETVGPKMAAMISHSRMTRRLTYILLVRPFASLVLLSANKWGQKHNASK